MLNWTESYGVSTAYAFRNMFRFEIEYSNGDFKIKLSGATSTTLKSAKGKFDTVEEAKQACFTWYVAQLKKELEKSQATE